MLHQLPPAAPAPVVEVADQRGEFPKKRCAGGGGPVQCTRAGVGRGSGRLGDETAVAYTVWVAGYETIKADDGEPISEAFVTDVIHLDVPSGGTFGWGEVKLIQDWVEHNMPGYTVMDAQAERDALAFAEF